MEDQTSADRPDPADAPAPPVFDREAARARYRATMRGPFMRSMYVLLALVLLVSWGFGIAAAIATDVERLPGHDLSVVPSECVACHTGQVNNAPAIPHMTFPTCGFCHRQGPPAPANLLITPPVTKMPMFNAKAQRLKELKILISPQ